MACLVHINDAKYKSGKSPVLPGITEGTPMTDSLITQADAVRLHFQRQETARAELRKYDSSRRLKEALKARLQPYFDVKYEEGDLIIFQDGNDQWNGPAEVKTMDSKTLFVIHNGQLKKVATCRARPWVEESEVESSESSENEDDLEEESLIENSEQIEIPSSEQESSKRMENESGKVPGTEKSARSRGSSKECSNRMENDTALMPSEGIVPEESSRRMESVETEEEASSMLETRQESSRRVDNEVTIQEHNDDLLQNKERRPKRGSMVIFQKDGETSKQSGRVKFVGKGTGKKKNTCWIEINGELEELDFMKHVSGWSYTEMAPQVQFRGVSNKEKIQELKKSESSKRMENNMEAEGVFYLTRGDQPKEVFAAVVPSSQYKCPEVQGAMHDEMHKWVLFDAYEIVKDEGQEAIDTRWNVLKKEGHDGLKTEIKARLCLRGFKESEKV